MKIYNNKYYIVESIPGISGFQRWDEREYRVVRGRTARALYKLHIVQEFLFRVCGRYRLEDGHLPDYQPITKNQTELYNHLDSGGQAFILSPELYGLKTKEHNS